MAKIWTKLFIGCLILEAASLRAATFDVNPGESIQDVIESATHGDVILVLPGVYQENLDLQGKGIHLRSLDPNNAFVVQETVIAGVDGAPAIRLVSGEPEGCRISGFTIRAGSISDGVRIESSSPTLEDCWILPPENSSRNYGVQCEEASASFRSCRIVGHRRAACRIVNSPLVWIEDCQLAESVPGVSIQSSTVTIVGSTIENNTSPEPMRGCGVGGGGIFVDSSNLVLVSTHIKNNQGICSGGGVYSSGTNLLVHDCQIDSNTSYAQEGGGLYLLRGTAEFRRTRFEGNSSGEAGGAIWGLFLSDLSFQDCGLVANTAKRSGGGVELWRCDSALFESCLFDSNECLSDGGALSINRMESCSMANSLVTHQTTQ
ncbi:MAG: right-handed parallel beta-helix repeat-containing protein, partial [Candidatus Omnitrophica bacterium]|nr:right-handed parallel beta-helix repeat-containing protein [Candidatus Omnitrophota bacterium]